MIKYCYNSLNIYKNTSSLNILSNPNEKKFKTSENGLL